MTFLPITNSSKNQNLLTGTVIDLCNYCTTTGEMWLEPKIPQGLSSHSASPGSYMLINGDRLDFPLGAFGVQLFY